MKCMCKVHKILYSLHASEVQKIKGVLETFNIIRLQLTTTKTKDAHSCLNSPTLPLSELYVAFTTFRELALLRRQMIGCHFLICFGIISDIDRDQTTPVI
jgi:hypothetical protein